MQILMIALLTLIQDDPESIDINWSEIDLTDDLNREIEHRSSKSGEPRIMLIAPKNIYVLADPGLLTGILTNILNKAIEYADSNTDIICEISAQDNCSCLTLRNHCQDIQKEDIEK